MRRVWDTTFSQNLQPKKQIAGGGGARQQEDKRNGDAGPRQEKDKSVDDASDPLKKARLLYQTKRPREGKPSNARFLKTPHIAELQGCVFSRPTTKDGYIWFDKKIDYHLPKFLEGKHRKTY